MPGLMNIIVEALLAVLGKIGDAFRSSAENFLQDLIELLVGTPHPQPGSGFVIGPPQNQPWLALYQYYHSTVLPLSFVLLGGVLGLIMFTNIFSSLLKGDEETDLERRLLLGFLLLLGWWPLGSVALTLADALAKAIAPTAAEFVGNFTGLFVGAVGSVVVLLALFLLEFSVILGIIIVYATRIALIYTLMVMMPFLIVLWIIDIAPFSDLSQMARGLMKLFTPAVFLTLPSAFLLRVALLVLGTDMGFSGIVSAFVSLGFLVLALVAPVFMFRETLGGDPVAVAGRVAPATSVRQWVQARRGEQTAEGTRGEATTRAAMGREAVTKPGDRPGGNQTGASSGRVRQASLVEFDALSQERQTALGDYGFSQSRDRQERRIQRQLRRSHEKVMNGGTHV